MPQTNSTLLGLDIYGSGNVIPSGNQARTIDGPTHAGLLIVNADDWGRDRESTDRAVECILQGTVSSVSAMVFMEDSERAAVIARERDVDVGVHINLTTRFSAPDCPARLVEHQRQLTHYLRQHRFAPIIFHPWLARSFEYVVAAQIDEFRRLYEKVPERLDGHHHMHLCANVLLPGLLPRGTIVRRNFHFLPGEKSLPNRLYRRAIDRILARRHRVVDYFFPLQPLVPATRLERIFSLGQQFVVEVGTHPVRAEEYRFLARGEIFQWARYLPIASRFAIPATGHT